MASSLCSTAFTLPNRPDMRSASCYHTTSATRWLLLQRLLLQRLRPPGTLPTWLPACACLFGAMAFMRHALTHHGVISQLPRVYL